MIDGNNAELIFERLDQSDIIKLTSLYKTLVDLVPQKRVNLLAFEVVTLDWGTAIVGRCVPGQQA